MNGLLDQYAKLTVLPLHTKHLLIGIKQLARNVYLKRSSHEQSTGGGEGLKVKDLILKLERARKSYIKKHGIEPSIYSWDADEGLMLCSKVQKFEDGATALKPYEYFAIPFTDTFGTHEVENGP